MSVRLFVSTLIATSALSAAAHAQNAPATTTPPPAPAPAQNIGTVTITEPAPRPSYAQPGLTAAPTDFTQNAPQPAAQTTTNVGIGNAPSTGTTPGGVTRTDIGGGYMINEEAKKTRSTVTRDAIDKLAPTANPYQMINLLPGVVATSTDNTGLNGGNIRIRGFNSDHLGLTIEGMPVNDSGNYALFPQEYVDGNNISHISIGQGFQELDSPHIGSAGGVINIYMRDPAKEAGGFASISLGSNNLRREFIRLETGEVGKFSAYVSYSNLMKNNWAGEGGDNRQHLDFKAKWGDKDNAIRFAAIYNYAVNTFYANPTLAQFNTPGYVPAQVPTLPASFLTPSGGNLDQSANNAANYHKYRINPFQNLILSAPSNFKISESVKFDTVPYFWYGFGNGGGTTTMSESGMFWGNMSVKNVNYGGAATLGDKILYYNPSITETYRPGVINKFTFNAGDHQIVAGHWFEYARHRQTAPYVPLNGDGSVDDPFAGSNQFNLPGTAACTSGGNAVTCPKGPMQRRDQLTLTTTNGVFLGDSWKINPKLTLDYGVKQIWVNREVTNYLPFAADPNGSLNDTATLPVAALGYKIDKENKVFASFGTSFRTAPNFTLISSYSATNGAYTPANYIPPERGRVFELGHRYQGSLFSTSLSAFNGYFDNYQQTTSVVDTKTGTTSLVSETVNVGRLMNYGVNGEIGTRPIYNFRPYVSFEVLRTQMLDNLPAAGKVGANTVNDFLPTSGKQLPGAPNFSLGIGLDYDDGHWFANTQYKYIGAQYATFMNDQEMAAFGRVDAGVGYRFSDVAGLKKPEIKLNVFNLTNARQLTGVNGTQTNALSTVGVNGSTIAGSNPTYFMGQGVSGMVTFSTGF